MNERGWKEALKRLQELQKTLPESIRIELTYSDSSSEVLSLEEVQKRDSKDWKLFRIVSGNKTQELQKFLEWLAPDSVID